MCIIYYCVLSGVYTGSSALAIAQVLPEGGKVVAMDVSEEWIDIIN